MNTETLTLHIHSLAHDGRGVARTGDSGQVVFVRGALPGQTVLALTSKSKKKFIEADTLEILDEAADAIAPPCPHYGECGGCPLQTMPEARQLFWKESFVREALKRIGHISENVVAPITPSPKAWDYRNKAEFAFGKGQSGELICGLRRDKSHEVFNISACLLMQGETAKIIDFIRSKARQTGYEPYDPQSDQGFWRKLTLRRANDGTGPEHFLASIVTGPGPSSASDAVAAIGLALLAHFPMVSGFAHLQKKAEDEKIVSAQGHDSLSITVSGLPFTIGQVGFFQINTGAAEILCDKMAQCAGLGGGETIWDLYCGGGLLGLSLLHRLQAAGGVENAGLNSAARKTRLYGIESNAVAVRSAMADAKKFGLTNCRFITGDVHKHAASLPPPDVVLADPPRGGMHPKAVEAILRAKPKRLVLASCNPATLARDVAALQKSYQLVQVLPVDLFPQTAHVESVALLKCSK